MARSRIHAMHMHKQVSSSIRVLCTGIQAVREKSRALVERP